MTKSRPAISAWENDRTIVRFPDPAVEVVDERFRSLVVWQEVVERLWTGGRWLEGPVWFGDGRYLLFSDIPNNRMLCWSEVTGDVTVFRQPSNNSNGNTRDRQGRLVTCEHLTRRVTRTEHDGTITVLMRRGDLTHGPYGIGRNAIGDTHLPYPCLLTLGIEQIGYQLAEPALLCSFHCNLF